MERSFNGAADFHRRKSPMTRPRAWATTGCFNGAADFHRRKYTDTIMAPSIQCASMGPPIFIGGNLLRLHTPV